MTITAGPAIGGRLRYEVSEGYLAIQVEDDGAGFDPTLPAPLLDPEMLDEGGLGLAIIRAVSEEFEFRPRDGQRGSCLRFGRSLR